jgi:phage tail sheath protein FI
MFQHPGVYIQHAVSSALAIEAASTSVAAFVGVARKAPNVSRAGSAPVLVTNPGEYAAAFGPPGGNAAGLWNDVEAVDHMGQAVNLFFANGGTKAYIAHVAKTAAKSAVAQLDFADGTARHRIELTAKLPGKAANGLLARIERSEIERSGTAFKLIIGTDATPGEANVQKKTIGTALETHDGITLTKVDATFVTTVLAARSALVTGVFSAQAAGAAEVFAPVNALTKGGEHWVMADKADYDAAFEALRDYRDISIILLPGQMFKDGQPSATIYESALAHAEGMQNRLVVIDPDPTVALATPTDVTAAKFPTSTYAVLYHPQVRVQNPFHDPDTAPTLPKTFDVGPAAAAAGLWARIDGTRGVWKTPAGLEATVRGTLGPVKLIGNDAQDNLNDSGINCLRSIIGPMVIWGGRTLATKAKPPFRYISVRRTQSMIGESLYRALQAVVFEPNDHKLWGALRASASDFMDGLHRSGAFQGEKASDAWHVRCGLGSTMTQGDIDAGIVRLVVGFAPLKPAEFVSVVIEQKVGQSAA